MPLSSRTFSQLIDFTRTSAATFVNSSGNIASTPQSRNLLTFTNEFANAAWTKTASTVTANSTAAPDGTMTADTLVETAATSGHVVNSSATVTTSAHVFSVYLKKGSGSTAPNWLQLYTGGVSAQYANFNLGTGAVGSVAAGSTATITSVGNGWYRCTLTFTPSSGGSASVAIAFTNNTDTTTRGLSYAGATTSDVFAWGAQLEAASAATDYTRNFGGLFPPRFDYDPVTRAPRGLLIEEQRTNLLLYSEQFDNGTWSKLRATVTADSTTSPDGTADADTLLDTAVAGTHVAIQTITKAASAITYAATVYAKQSTLSKGELRVSDQAGNGVRAAFDLAAGTVGSATGFGTGFTAVSSAITSAGNGWYRITLIATSNSATTLGHEVYLADGSGSTSYTGTGAGIFIWGAQLEAGAFATSYIPTVASQVTRTADTAAINAPNFASWYNQSAGSFVVEFQTVPISITLSRGMLDFDTNLNKRIVYIASGGTQAGTFDGSGVITASGSVISGTAKVAMAYSASDRAVTTNGGTVATGAAPAAGFTASTSLNIGGTSGSGSVNGYIRSVRYYPTRLTNAQLQALTA